MLEDNKVVIEEWRDVVGYEDYYKISSLGNIRSFYYDTNLGKRLRFLQNNRGYLCVNLYKNGKSKKLQIHKLVLEAFVALCPQGMECRHLDGNSINNKLDNLKWGTRAENTLDSMKHGTRNQPDNCGIKNGRSKLTEREVGEIRQLYSTKKWTQKQLAKKFHISRGVISKIVVRLSWKHVT